MSKLNLNRKLKGHDLISDIIGKPDINNGDGDINGAYVKNQESDK